MASRGYRLEDTPKRKSGVKSYRLGEKPTHKTPDSMTRPKSRTLMKEKTTYGQDIMRLQRDYKNARSQRDYAGAAAILRRINKLKSKMK